MMKLTIFSFNTAEELNTLENEYGFLGCDLMTTEHSLHGCYYTLTANASIGKFKELMSWGEEHRLVCNNGDMVNFMLGYCADHKIDCRVITVDRDGSTHISPLGEEGYLTNWSYGWYIPDES